VKFLEQHNGDRVFWIVGERLCSGGAEPVWSRVRRVYARGEAEQREQQRRREYGKVNF
jgi:hypothetical protein